MKVVGLNGREYNLDTKKYLISTRTRRSFYHLQARELIVELFHPYQVLEEVTLPGSSMKRSKLALDFLIPSCTIGIEIHGEQHFKYTPFFHKSKAGFAQAKKRDLDKKEWCRINDIKLIELRWDESVEYWREKIEHQRAT
jgi:hypothetical protein